MNEPHLPRLLRQLATEPAVDREDPWPAVERRLAARRSARSRPLALLAPVRSSRRRLAAAVVGACAALLVVGGGTMLLWDRPQPASAAVLGLLQVEALGDASVGTQNSACGHVAGTGTELTDRLGQQLGMSGDRVRAAIRQALATDQQLAPQGDLLARVAQDLGVSLERTRQALADPQCPRKVVLTSPMDPQRLTTAAQVLGVRPDRLQAALQVALPRPPAANEQAALDRLAQALGVSRDRLQAALQQVEGPNRIYLPQPRSPGQP